ncbi:MAG: hypothetical protein ABIL58_00515 [Pseudomonadota bacterium]
MIYLRKTVVCLTLLLLLAAPVFYGCEGSKPREQVDDTVKELSGQKKVDQMKQMKQDIGAIQTGQDERVKQLDQTTDK